MSIMALKAITLLIMVGNEEVYLACFHHNWPQKLSGSMSIKTTRRKGLAFPHLLHEDSLTDLSPSRTPTGQPQSPSRRFPMCRGLVWEAGHHDDDRNTLLQLVGTKEGPNPAPAAARAQAKAWQLECGDWLIFRFRCCLAHVLCSGA